MSPSEEDLSYCDKIGQIVAIKPIRGAIRHLPASLNSLKYRLVVLKGTPMKIQLLLLSALASSLLADEARLPFHNSDFEAGDLSHWTVEGTAFEGNPVALQPDAKDQRLHGSMQGDFCASSSVKGDWHSGRLTSPEFIIDRDTLTFLIAGGVGQGTRVELLVEGEAVQDCSGIENWILKPNYFDLRQWRGQSAQIRIVDEVEAPWGHIIADDF